MIRPILLVLCVGACSSSSPPVERATVGNLAFEVPAGWNRRDLSTHQRPMFEWTPTHNERRESVTLIRVERAALAKAGAPQIERLLLEAQQNLPGGKFGSTSRLTTKHGFSGARVEGELTPAGQTQPFTRIHAVLVDGKSLVHVIYTARDADREAFEIVLDSLHLDRGA